jgi:hypothetical protein
MKGKFKMKITYECDSFLELSPRMIEQIENMVEDAHAKGKSKKKLGKVFFFDDYCGLGDK